MTQFNFFKYSFTGMLLLSSQLPATEIIGHTTDMVKAKTLKATLHTDEPTESIKQFKAIEIDLENFEIGNNLALLQSISFSLDLGGQERTSEDLRKLKSLAPLISGLNLYEASIDNECMEVISTLTSLKHLDLSRNYFNDDGMRHLSSLKELERLAIVYNKVTAQGIQPIVMLPKLEEVDAGCTYLGNEGIQAISQSKSIRILNIRACGFDDQALPYLNDMKNLQKVILSNNKISTLALQKFIESNKHRNLEVVADELTK